MIEETETRRIPLDRNVVIVARVVRNRATITVNNIKLAIARTGVLAYLSALFFVEPGARRIDPVVIYVTGIAGIRPGIQIHPGEILGAVIA
jgi:hypothetical protein